MYPTCTLKYLFGLLKAMVSSYRPNLTRQLSFGTEVVVIEIWGRKFGTFPKKRCIYWDLRSCWQYIASIFWHSGTTFTQQVSLANGLTIPLSVPIISMQSRPKIEISQGYRIDTSENSTDLSLRRRPLSNLQIRWVFRGVSSMCWDLRSSICNVFQKGVHSLGVWVTSLLSRVAPPITVTFDGEVGVFTPLISITKCIPSDFRWIWTWGGAPSSNLMRNRKVYIWSSR